MPTNTIHAGMRMPSHVMNSMGVWISNKFAGMRLGKNTRISDIQRMHLGRKKLTPTSPIVRTKQNDGHANLSRMRNKRTKRIKVAKCQGIPVEGTISNPVS